MYLYENDVLLIQQNEVTYMRSSEMHLKALDISVNDTQK